MKDLERTKVKSTALNLHNRIKNLIKTIIQKMNILIFFERTFQKM